MDEREREQAEEGAEESFAEMLEKSLGGAVRRLEPGQRVTATVLRVGAEWILLDVGQKGEGVLDAGELRDSEGAMTVAAGDRLQAYFLAGEGEELRFTTRIGGGAPGTAGLEQAWESGIPVEGRVEREIKGGYEIRLAGGARAFCPFSQLGLGRTEEAGEAVGRTLPFRITQFGGKGRGIVVSHRAILEEERRARREALRQTLREGMVVEGTVTGVRDFGAFVDIGGIDGLLPVSEIGWGRTAKAADALAVGQTVRVEIKGLDWERERFTFSLRATLADPWTKAAAVYRPGTTHAGTVARLAPFGAFVTLEDGVDGLLHVSRLGGGKRVSHPREVLREGQQLRVTVTEIDASRRRISLAPEAPGSGGEETASYVDQPPTSLGTIGDLLREGLGKKRGP